MVGYIWSLKMCGNREEPIYSDQLAEDTNCGEEGRQRTDMKKKDLQSNHPEI